MEIDTTPLNNEWIHNFDKIDKLYKDFYKDDIYYTNLNIIYLNNDNEIEKIKQESFLLSKCNYITTEEIIQILKENMIDQSKKYSLLSILKYNITLNPENIISYLSPDYSINNNDFLTSINHIMPITFEKSISMFHDLTDLIIIFYDKSVKSSAHNVTKKIVLQSNRRSHKNTHRKQYKA
jgi:hypothetical protein